MSRTAKMIRLGMLISVIICGSIDPSQAARSAGTQGNPCSEVKCYFNSMCVVDPTTDAAICVCPEGECDGVPDFPLCAGGMTFKSACHAQTYMCKAQKLVAIQHAGPCGNQICSAEMPCPFYGRCVMGVCSCVRCQDVAERRGFLDVRPLRRTSVCGSDGIQYDSECHLRYHACISRSQIAISRRAACHDKIWRKSDPLEEEVEEKENPGVDSLEGPACAKYELHGCLPARHRRASLLGIYSLIRGQTFLDSPVYAKYSTTRIPFRKDSRSIAYLSRYNSSTFPDGSWIVGSKVGSGTGWFGVNDRSPHPRGITNIWRSTAGPPNRPWVAEPRISGRCVGSPKRKTYRECNLGQERGRLGINWQSAAQQTPMYELTIKRPRDKFYRPGKKLVVEIFTNNLARRFVSVYVSLENDADSCGVPEVAKVQHRFDFHCNNTVISRSGRKMRRTIIQFRAPPRGCVTFKALVKAANGEVFYDDNEKGSLAPTPLTKKVCHIGYTDNA